MTENWFGAPGKVWMMVPGHSGSPAGGWPEPDP